MANNRPDQLTSHAIPSYNLAIATVAAAIAIFAFDTITGFEIAASALYVGVVLIAVRFLEARAVTLVAAGCVTLAVASHILTHHGPLATVALLNLLIGIAAIVITTYLALVNQSAQVTLRRQASLLDVTHDTIFVRDLNDVITYWNRGAEQLYEWTSQEAVGKVTHRLMQTIFSTPLEQITETLLRTGRWEGELVHTKRDGTRAHVDSRWSLQRDEQERPIAILETNNDITDRKRIEAQLRESERRYRHIFQTAGVSIWEEDFSQVKAAIEDLKASGVKDLSRYLADNPEFVERAVSMIRIIDVNDTSVRLFEAKDKSELLSSLGKLFTPETAEVFAGELVAISQGQQSFEAETVLQTLQGRKLSVVLTVAFSPENTKADNVLVSIMDVTSVRRAEDELQQMRMELAHINRVTTLGQLAASIAHEVNQPITSVVVNADTALRWLRTESPAIDEVREALEAVSSDGIRAGEIINRIRTLVRKVPARKDILQINEVIQQIVALTRNEAQRCGVALQTSLASHLPSISGDRVQLQQVLLNLVLNAIEAMASVEHGPRQLLISTSRDSANGALVTVRDSGSGLDPTKSDQLFRAFYTTKSSGMGMGLSICRSIVEAHDGRIWATSNADGGATFQFRLPPLVETA
jgi:PAS domain S-box-containing protein